MYSYRGELTGTTSLTTIVEDHGFFDIREMRLTVEKSETPPLRINNPNLLFLLESYEKDYRFGDGFQKAQDVLNRVNVPHTVYSKRDIVVFNEIPSFSYLSIKHYLEKAIDGTLFRKKKIVSGLFDSLNSLEGVVDALVDLTGHVHVSQKIDNLHDLWESHLTEEENKLRSSNNLNLMEEKRLNSYARSHDSLDKLPTTCNTYSQTKSQGSFGIMIEMSKAEVKKLTQEELELLPGFYTTDTGEDIFVQHSINLSPCTECSNGYLIPFGYRWRD